MTTKEFFEVLYPNLDKRKNKLQVVLIDAYKQPSEKGYITWKLFSNIEEVVNFTTLMDNKERYHVYFRCPELKPSASSGTEKDIACHPFLYTDIDTSIKDKNGNVIEKRSKEDLLKRIKKSPLSPTIIVDSGNGYHVYWKLALPLYEMERVKFLLSSIQEYLGGDPRAKLTTQLLRVPNTHNRKTQVTGGEPLLVNVIEYNNNTYTVKDFFTSLDLREEDVYSLKTSLISPPPTSNKTTCNQAISSSDNDVICFDFTKKIEPLNIKIDNFPDLLETIKKQNILLASNISPSSIGKTFRCCFHKDEYPSANVFISRNGHYLYKCFGCDRTYDIISIYQEINKKSFAESLQDLAKFFGITYKQSKWVKEQINKYYSNLVTLLNFEKYDYKAMYPYFYKLFNSRSHYLYFLNSFGLGAIRSEKESYEGESVFCMSYDYFTKTFSRNRVTYITAQRYINLFCTLGLIKKVPIKNVPKHLAANAFEHAERIADVTKKDSDKIKPINFYIVYNIQDRLDIANRRAKKLIENGFKISETMNKEFLIITFGQAVADEVYPDERTISKRNKSIASRLETTLTKLIAEQGYATKDQIISKTKLSGRLKANRQDKKRELEKYFKQMLNNHNLEYVRPNKDLIKQLNLKKATFIIIPKGLKD